MKPDDTNRDIIGSYCIYRDILTQYGDIEAIQNFHVPYLHKYLTTGHAPQRAMSVTISLCLHYFQPWLQALQSLNCRYSRAISTLWNLLYFLYLRPLVRWHPLWRRHCRSL